MTIQQKIQSSLDSRGLTAYKLCKTLGVPRSSFSRFMTENHPFASRHLVAVLNYLELV